MSLSETRLSSMGFGTHGLKYRLGMVEAWLARNRL